MMVLVKLRAMTALVKTTMIHVKLRTGMKDSTDEQPDYSNMEGKLFKQIRKLEMMSIASIILINAS